MKRFFLFFVIKSAAWILWRYQTANFDTDVGNTKTVLKNFYYYSLYICPPLFYFLIFYRPQTKFGQGNIFTGICLSTGG